MEAVTILGSGPAGLTAAVYAARADLEPLVLAGDMPGGQLTQTTDVENYPGFADGVLGFDLMENFQKQAKRFGTRIRNDLVTRVRLQQGGPHTLTLTSGETLETRALIVATGARPRYLELPSEHALRNKGVSYCATCDGAFFRDVPVAVVGGGDSAIEEALFLTRFAAEVFVIHRRDKLRASRIMQDRAFDNPKIRFCWNSVVAEVLDVKQDKVTGLVVENLETGETSTVACEAMFVAIGHIPNTQLLAGQLDMDAQGFLRSRGCTGQSSVDGVYVAGDCADHIYRQAITAAGMGCRAAVDAERWLASLG